MKKDDENAKPKINRSALAASLRKDKSEFDYIHSKKQPTFLTDPRIKEWHHWFLVNNEYPYDMAFGVHHLLLPLREVTENDLNQNEKDELEEIIQELSGQYDARIINYPQKQSVRQHFHIHLVSYKQNRSDMVF